MLLMSDKEDKKLLRSCNILPVFFIIMVLCLPAETQDSWRGPAHFVISTGGSFALAELPELFTSDPGCVNKYLFSSTLMLTAGFLKEGMDEMNGKYFSWEDIGVDCLGIASGIVLNYILLHRKKSRIKTEFRPKSKRLLISYSFAI